MVFHCSLNLESVFLQYTRTQFCLLFPFSCFSKSKWGKKTTSSVSMFVLCSFECECLVWWLSSPFTQSLYPHVDVVAPFFFFAWRLILMRWGCSWHTLLKTSVYNGQPVQRKDKKLKDQLLLHEGTEKMHRDYFELWIVQSFSSKV